MYVDLASRQRSLAQEIRNNPDKSWKSTLIERYRAFMNHNGQHAEIAPIETWAEGSAEFTEAVLRLAGFGEVRA